MMKILKSLAPIVFILVMTTVGFAQSNFDFESLFDGRYTQETVDAPNWMKNGKFYTAIFFNDSTQVSEIRKYNITNSTYEVLVRDSDLIIKDLERKISIQDYQFSSDETKLLIQTDVESIWRRSKLAFYYAYDLKTKETIQLTNNEIKIGNAEFSPKGDKVAFTRLNDLYVIDLITLKEVAITKDGEYNKIINGSSDWVYEEEFSFSKAWFWSPDGNKIAFYRFDESIVKEFFYTRWGSSNYPEKVVYKYPKAGEQNATVKVGVYTINSNKTQWIPVEASADEYIVRVNWTNSSDKLAIRKMNRLQNEQNLILVNLTKNSAEILKREGNDQWIEENDALTFLEDGSSFIYMSEEDGYNHIYLYSKNGKEVKQLTSGAWDVTSIVGINEDRKELYYLSAEDSPLNRQLYKISFDGKKKTKLTVDDGTHTIEMSKDQQYYLDYFSSNKSPNRVSLHDSEGKLIKVLENNSVLLGILKKEPLLNKEFLEIPIDKDLKLNAWMIKPPNFDAAKKYPVLMYVYGGPGSQTVTNDFETDQRSLWHHFLASKGYIVVSVDNRGTGARGAKFKKVIYKELGKYEISDQIASAKYLKTLSYVDADRVGIWGWSYGGFMSSLGLTRGSDVFKTAIAVAPVIDWRYYDTIYTERYMQTPDQNPEGYKNASPIFEASNIKGKYLLIHGTGDDNVHFQNSVTMADALQYFNVPFQTMFYPNRNHGIYGGETRRHLYTLMSNFIFENL